MSRRFTSFSQLLMQPAAESPALFADDGIVTFGNLRRNVAQSVAALQSVTGSVAVVGGNHRLWVELYYAVPLAQKTLTLLNHRLSESELREQIKRAQAEVVIGEEHYVQQIRSGEDVDLKIATFNWAEWESQRDKYSGDESIYSVSDPEVATRPAWLLFTSGTTARPKGALLSQTNILAAVEASAQARPVDPDDVYVFPFPLCHVAGYNVIHRHAHGRPVVLLEKFDAEKFCDAVEQHQATSTSVAATMLATLCDYVDAEPERKQQLQSLRIIAYGAAPMNTQLLQRAHQLLSVDFTQGYGMTEAAGNAVFLGVEEHRKGLAGDVDILKAAGRPAPGVQLRLGENDEIELKASQIMLGYLDDEEATKNALRAGWLRTGDIGRLEDDLLYVVDRAKDIVITGGENVSSLEVENVLASHPCVAQVAVIGLPDEKWGEKLCAVVVEAAPVTDDELKGFARKSLAGFKIPKEIFRLENLPTNTVGKIMKSELRSIYVVKN